jgi:DNA-binding NarL/FixJ family response regulator
MDGEPASTSRDDAAPRVLVIEDNVFIAFDLEAQLGAMGCQVVGIAVTADAAIKIAREDKPDLAIVDLKLANGSRGQDAARVLRVELGIPSIILSGSLHSLTVDERDTICPLAMLSKPALPRELQSAVEKLSES